MSFVVDMLNSEHGLLQPRATPVDYEHFRKVPFVQYQIATVILIMTPITFTIAVVTFAGRAYTRMWPSFRFGVDDYLISIAFVLMTVMWSFQYDAVIWAYGFNHPPTRSLASVERAVRDGQLALPFWAGSTGLTKISIAWMLLRFHQTMKWRIFIYFIMFINIVFIVWLGIANCFTCIPYASQWDLIGRYPNKKCWSTGMVNLTQYVTVSICVTSDVALALVPLTFLTKVQRPLREKIVIGGLLGLGVFASAFSISRVVAQVKKDIFPDPSSNAIFNGFMTCMESQVAFIAACVPALRSSTNRWLHKIGIWKGSTAASRNMYGKKSTGYGAPSSKGTELENMPGRNGNGGIVKKTTIHTHVTGSNGSDQFIMDPHTGQIVSEADLKDQDSVSKLNVEWEGEPNHGMKEEWETQRGGGTFLRS